MEKIRQIIGESKYYIIILALLLGWFGYAHKTGWAIMKSDPSDTWTPGGPNQAYGSRHK